MMTINDDVLTLRGSLVCGHKTGCNKMHLDERTETKVKVVLVPGTWYEIARIAVHHTSP